MKIFGFLVDSSGNFTFDVEGNWNYTIDDEVEFTSMNQFVIQLIPETPGAPFSPFVSGKSTLKARRGPGGGFRTGVERVRGKEESDQVLVNQLAELHPGTHTLARYRYAISAEAGGQAHLNINKLGEWGC